MVAALGGGPPIDAVADAVAAGGEVLQPRFAFARRRQAVIAANPELQERELRKIAAALAATLRERGVAGLAAEAGLVAFRAAFERWVAEPEARDLPALIRATLDELRAVSSGAR